MRDEREDLDDLAAEWEQPGDEFLIEDAGLPAEQVGRINVNEFSTYVAVAREAAQKALAALNDRPVKGKRVKARLLA